MICLTVSWESWFLWVWKVCWDCVFPNNLEVLERSYCLIVLVLIVFIIIEAWWLLNYKFWLWYLFLSVGNIISRLLTIISRFSSWCGRLVTFWSFEVSKTKLVLLLLNNLHICSSTFWKRVTSNLNSLSLLRNRVRSVKKTAALILFTLWFW